MWAIYIYNFEFCFANIYCKGRYAKTLVLNHDNQSFYLFLLTRKTNKCIKHKTIILKIENFSKSNI